MFFYCFLNGCFVVAGLLRSSPTTLPRSWGSGPTAVATAVGPLCGVGV